MTDAISVFAVLLAAGSGRRTGLFENKLFSDIRGMTILERAARRLFLHPKVTGGVVVTAKGEMERVRSILKNLEQSRPLDFVSGGSTRQESAYRGLLAAKKRADSYDAKRSVALIHDAARCFVSDRIIDDVIGTIISERAGVAPAIPLTDTTRLLDPSGKAIETTLPRERLVLMQTPQGADLDILIQAFDIARANGEAMTDDLELLLRIGYPTRLVTGERQNIKITVMEDLALARQLAEREHDL